MYRPMKPPEMSSLRKH